MLFSSRKAFRSLLYLRAEVTKKLPIYKGQIVETGGRSQISDLRSQIALRDWVLRAEILNLRSENLRSPSAPHRSAFSPHPLQRDQEHVVLQHSYVVLEWCSSVDLDRGCEDWSAVGFVCQLFNLRT